MSVPTTAPVSICRQGVLALCAQCGHANPTDRFPSDTRQLPWLAIFLLRPCHPPARPIELRPAPTDGPPQALSVSLPLPRHDPTPAPTLRSSSRVLRPQCHPNRPRCRPSRRSRTPDSYTDQRPPGEPRWCPQNTTRVGWLSVKGGASAVHGAPRKGPVRAHGRPRKTAVSHQQRPPCGACRFSCLLGVALE